MAGLSKFMAAFRLSRKTAVKKICGKKFQIYGFFSAKPEKPRENYSTELY